MKLFTNEDIRAIERQTLSAEAITIHTLVQRAAAGIADEIAQRWRTSKRIVVFAGPGGNGADALAASSLLIDRGYNPEIHLFNIGGNALNDACRRCRDNMRNNYPDADFHEVTASFNPPMLSETDLVIDGLFGSGLREPLSGGFLMLVRYINENNPTVVSIDVPSGMFGDWNHQVSPRNVIHAHLTLAIQFPRISFFMPESAELLGTWKTIDIGLSRQAIDKCKSNFHLVEEHEIQNLLRPRPLFCSKADFGSALIVAGRYGMGGAAVLAATGAIRAGAGKVTLYSPQCLYPIAQTAVPEAMFEADDDKLMISQVRADHPYNAYAIGPGLGTSEVTVNAVETFIKQTKSPIVIDADALNCIARRPAILNSLPILSVITPHAGEFDRLFGEQTSHEARILKAIEMSRYYNILILLKGHYSALIRPDGKVYFNSSGTPALATPGSGDVLTGVIAAFLAQGYKPEVSAIIAPFVHGMAGRLAEKVHGQFGTAASDVALNIGTAIMNIMQPNNSL